MMKPQELKQARVLRERNLDELRQAERELAAEILKMRFKRATGQLETPADIHAVRRNLARVKTVIREKSADAAKGA